MQIAKTSIALKKLLDIAFRQIDAGKDLRLKRLQEFQDSAPNPPRDFDTDDPRLAVAHYHDYLSNLAGTLTASSPYWEHNDKSTFNEALILLEKSVKNSQIAKVNRNLVHFHRHLLCLASGNYTDALSEIQHSTCILKEHLLDYPTDFDIERDIILNKGREVLIELYRGNANNAVNLAFEMETMTSLWEKNADYEKLNSLCPLTDWMRYYRCVALVSKQDDELPLVEQKRQMSFDTAYTKRSYERWPMPTLFPILLSEEWKISHKGIFEKVADRVYMGENVSFFRNAMRRIAVRLGRRELRVAPTLLVAAVICFSVFSLIDDADKNAVPTTAVIEYVQNLPYQASNEELTGIQLQREDLVTVAEAVSVEILAIENDGFIRIEDISEGALKDGVSFLLEGIGFDLAFDSNERVIKSKEV